MMMAITRQNHAGETQAATPWAGAHDLRLMADRLDPGQFRALSAGLGLGELRSRGEPRAPAPRFAPLTSTSTDSAGAPAAGARRPAPAPRRSQSSGSTGVFGRLRRFRLGAARGSKPAGVSVDSAGVAARPAPLEAPAEAPAQRPPRQRLAAGAWRSLNTARRVTGWAVDFLLVFCMAAAAAAGLILLGGDDGIAGRSLADWLTLPAVAALAKAPVWAPLAALWGLYTLYMVVFRLVAGVTPGEWCLGAFRARNVSG